MAGFRSPGPRARCLPWSSLTLLVLASTSEQCPDLDVFFGWQLHFQLAAAVPELIPGHCLASKSLWMIELHSMLRMSGKHPNACLQLVSLCCVLEEHAKVKPGQGRSNTWPSRAA